MKITKDDIRNAKETDMCKLLAEHGYIPSFNTSTVTAYRSMLPGRFESNPSFMVRKKDNKWMDYGYDGGKPHDAIDFIQMYKEIGFQDAIRYLLNGTTRPEPFIPPPPKKKPSVQIEDIREIISPQIYEYILGRGISPHRARHILKEVEISFPYGKNPDRKYLLVGHRTDGGGYDLRNKFFKTISVSPKTITTIKGIGNNYSVFEGVMDYLSLLEHFKIEQMRSNVIILNSCAFAGSIAPFLSGKRVYAFTDNDKAGQESIDILRGAGVDVIDERHLYDGYNDLNDFITGKKL